MAQSYYYHSQTKTYGSQIKIDNKINQYDFYKKIMKKIKSFVLLLVIVCSFGCNNNNENKTQNESKKPNSPFKGVSVKDNVLCFENEAAKSSFFDNIKDSAKNAVWQQYAKAVKFESYENFYNQMTEAMSSLADSKDTTAVKAFIEKYKPYVLFDKEGDNEELVDYPNSLIANKEGKIKIADKEISLINNEKLKAGYKRSVACVATTCIGENDNNQKICNTTLLRERPNDNYHTYKIETELYVTNHMMDTGVSLFISTLKITTKKRGILGIWFPRFSNIRLSGNIAYSNTGISWNRNVNPATSPVNFSFRTPGSNFISINGSNITYDIFPDNTQSIITYFTDNGLESGKITPWTNCTRNIEIIATFIRDNNRTATIRLN